MLKSESNEEPEDVRTLVVGDAAIVSFNRRWTVTLTAANVRSTGKSRMTETLRCRAGPVGLSVTGRNR